VIVWEENLGLDYLLFDHLETEKVENNTVPSPDNRVTRVRGQLLKTNNQDPRADSRLLPNNQELTPSLHS
jgi:hypothetical protein